MVAVRFNPSQLRSLFAQGAADHFGNGMALLVLTCFNHGKLQSTL